MVNGKISSEPTVETLKFVFIVNLDFCQKIKGVNF